MADLDPVVADYLVKLAGNAFNASQSNNVELALAVMVNTYSTLPSYIDALQERVKHE